MRKRCIALVLCLLTLAALAGCGEGSAKTVTSNGVECYRVDGVCYPAVFGEPQLTGEEITALLDGGDTAEMAATVNTVPDALRLLKARQQDSEDIDSQDAETTLLRGSSQPRGWVEALLYLLAGDYEESGRIDLYSSSNYGAYAAIAQDGLYYAFDPFEIRGDCWLVLSGENYVNADAQKLADMLRTACGFSTSAYTANAYPVLSKEEQEQRKAFEQREYTDEEIQALADAGISFAEACEKISTVADAAQFLEARGYSFAPDDAGTGAELRYQLNNGGCVGTSALFGALLNGDYDEVGYVYVFWLESEHVFNYVKQDGVYYACDFIYGPVTQSGTDARRSYIRYSGESLSGLFDAYAQQEGSDIGNAVAIMYTTAYCGDPTMPTVGLRDSADGHQSTIHLSKAEKDTQQILLLRDGYTFTFTSCEVECYSTDGVCYPAVFGEPQLTEEEITALLDSGDTAEMAVTVSTVPDALRLLKARQQDSEDIDSQDAETTLLRGSSQPRGWVEALLYLLAGDYEESGRIDLYSSSNYGAYAAIAQDGLYYAFDPFEIRGDCWLVLSGENYVNADAQKLADMLRTACGFSTSAYTANAYPVLSKED